MSQPALDHRALDHRALERALAKAGLPRLKVNPCHARHFAEAIGRQAKTDPLDAALLAQMASLLNLEPQPVLDETIVELQELLVARTALVKDRTASRNQAKIMPLPLLKQQNKERLRQIDRHIARIDADIDTRIKGDATLERFPWQRKPPGTKSAWERKEIAIFRDSRIAENALARRHAILTSIPGTAAITACALLIDMPELGSLERGQLS